MLRTCALVFVLALLVHGYRTHDDEEWDTGPEPSSVPSLEHSKQYDELDSDEFEGFEKMAVPRSHDAHIPSFWMFFAFETASTVLVVLFVLNYVAGKKYNKMLAEAFFRAWEPHLFAQFSRVDTGTREQPGAIMYRDAGHFYRMHASGRRGCDFMTTTLLLQERQNLIAQMIGVFISSPDIAVLEVHIPVLAPMALVISQDGKQRKRIHSQQTSLFGTSPGNGILMQQFDAVPGMLCESESQAVVDAILDQDLVTCIKHCREWLLSIVIADAVLSLDHESLKKTQKYYTDNDATIKNASGPVMLEGTSMVRIEFRLPPMQKMRLSVPIVSLVCNIVDRCSESSSRLPATAVRQNKHLREVAANNIWKALQKNV
jgi:hypothetical protein